MHGNSLACKTSVDMLTSFFSIIYEFVKIFKGRVSYFVVELLYALFLHSMTTPLLE